MESDATSSSLDRTVSLEIISAVTQDSDHVADQDADNDEDQGQAIGDVKNPLQLEEPTGIHVSPSWLTTNDNTKSVSITLALHFKLKAAMSLT